MSKTKQRPLCDTCQYCNYWNKDGASCLIYDTFTPDPPTDTCRHYQPEDANLVHLPA